MVDNYLEYLQIKLLNVLKGSALSVKSANDKMMTPEQKMAEMQAIEHMVKYIREYKRNMQIIEQNNSIENIEPDYII